jgi:quercetin dioxygenase-like cupin family protein
MSLVDTSTLRLIERLPGWRARIVNSASMTFAHYEFDAGSTIHEHHHEQEEVWNVIEGELELTIDGVVQRAGPGLVAIVPPNTPHSVRALSDGRAIIVDHPLRLGFG